MKEVPRSRYFAAMTVRVGAFVVGIQNSQRIGGTDFRFNEREGKDADRFGEALGSVAGAG